MNYAEKLRDPRWQKKRLEVLNRDNFSCRDCGVSDKPLHVHHCHYERGLPWEIDSSLLLTLCDGCHETRQQIEDKGKRSLGLILARMINDGSEFGLGQFTHELALFASKPRSNPAIVAREEVPLIDLGYEKREESLR